MESQWPRNVEQQIFPGFNVSIATFCTNCMCLATVTPKCTGIQKKKNVLYRYHCTDLWRTFDESCFLSHISNNGNIRNNYKKMKKKIQR